MIVQRNACHDATLRRPYRSEGMLMPKAEEIGPLADLGGGLRSVAGSGLCCEDTLRFHDISWSYCCRG